ITSATGQEEQVDFMVSLGCENGGLEHLHFPPKAHLHPDLTTPRKHPLTHSRNGRAGNVAVDGTFIAAFGKYGTSRKRDTYMGIEPYAGGGEGMAATSSTKTNSPTCPRPP